MKKILFFACLILMGSQAVAQSVYCELNATVFNYNNTQTRLPQVESIKKLQGKNAWGAFSDSACLRNKYFRNSQYIAVGKQWQSMPLFLEGKLGSSPLAPNLFLGGQVGVFIKRPITEYISFFVKGGVEFGYDHAIGSGRVIEKFVKNNEIRYQLAELKKAGQVGIGFYSVINTRLGSCIEIAEGLNLSVSMDWSADFSSGRKTGLRRKSFSFLTFGIRYVMP